MKFYFATCFFISVYQFVFSQIEFNSYYINLSSDTVRCEMIDKDWLKNPDYFLIEENGIQKKIFPVTTKQVKTPSGEIYSGHILLLDVTQVNYKNKSMLQLEQMRIDSAKIMKLDTVFLRKIVGGKYSLFELNDYRGKVHFFYSTESGTPVELKFSIKIEKEHSTGFFIIQEQKEFVNQLLHMNNSYVFYPDELDHLKYDRKSFEEYFISINKSTINYQIKSESTEYRTGINILTGMNRLKQSFPGESEYKSPYSFCFGFSVYERIIPPNDHRKFSASAGFGIHSNGIITDSIFRTKMDYKDSTHFYRMNYLNGEINMNYELTATTVRPFIEGGFMYSRMINYRNTVRKSYGTSTNLIAIKEEFTKHDEEQVYIGAGVRWPNYYVSLVYSRSNGFDSRLLFNSRIDCISLKLAIEFYKYKKKKHA